MSKAQPILNKQFNHMGEADNYFKKAVYFVSATNQESHNIWEKYKYEQINPSPVKNVGSLAGHDVWYSFYFVKLNGHIICFFDCTSQVNVYSLAEDWIKHHFNPITTDGRIAITDATNFHHAAHEIIDLNKQDKTINRWIGKDPNHL